jgi:hypothetical protein
MFEQNQYGKSENSEWKGRLPLIRMFVYRCSAISDSCIRLLFAKEPVLDDAALLGTENSTQ